MRQIERILVAQRRATANGLTPPRLYAYSSTDPESASSYYPRSVITARPILSLGTANMEFEADEMLTVAAGTLDEVEAMVHLALHGAFWAGPEGVLQVAYHVTTEHAIEAGEYVSAKLKWWGLATWRPTYTPAPNP